MFIRVHFSLTLGPDFSLEHVISFYFSSYAINRALIVAVLWNSVQFLRAVILKTAGRKHIFSDSKISALKALRINVE